MNVDFFETECKEAPRTNLLFGLCDDQNGTKAYSNTDNQTIWIARVKNEQQKEVSFTAIDNCIIVLKEGTKEKRSTCDGMLTFTDSLYLVELKERGVGGWIPGAIDQLESTIQIMYENNNLADFKYKKAYACNKKHPSFTEIDNELNLRFFRTYRFRLDVQAEIVIK